MTLKNLKESYALIGNTTYMCMCRLCSVTICRQTIMEDEFIKERIEELLRNIRQQVLVKVIRPYTKVRIAFLSEVYDMICMYKYYS